MVHKFNTTIERRPIAIIGIKQYLSDVEYFYKAQKFTPQLLSDPCNKPFMVIDHIVLQKSYNLFPANPHAPSASPASIEIVLSFDILCSCSFRLDNIPSFFKSYYIVLARVGSSLLPSCLKIISSLKFLLLLSVLLQLFDQFAYQCIHVSSASPFKPYIQRLLLYPQALSFMAHKIHHSWSM